jgi:hypothetical protein
LERDEDTLDDIPDWNVMKNEQWYSRLERDEDTH